ncbi:MAG TPA: histidine kinase, partial [Baekduia sp.]|nr:histidine kinase [Baekduia sp.]
MSSNRFAEHGGGVVARPTAGDVARAVLVAAVCAGLTFLVRDELLSDGARDLDALWLALTAVACAPIAFRRVAPVGAAVVALSVALLGVAIDVTMTGPIVVALGLVARATSSADLRTTGALGVFSGAVIAAVALIKADSDPLLGALSGIAVGMLPALAGDKLRAERVRTHDARELARRVEELRDRDVQRAVAEERLRIARDVHDITGHHLSAISLQSAGAGRTTTDPVARAAFERIHALTTEALGQTRRALGVLRHESEPAAALAPPPRLAHVEHLLQPARAAGIDVGLSVDGYARELSETAEMCAYRVIQESLTNVVRHAGARAVRIGVDYGEATLTVVVDDDGCGGRGADVRAGGGIEGMRERVALVGGSLAAGPR